MRNLLIWHKLFKLTDAVSRSEFEELVEATCDKGVTFVVARGRVYLRPVDEKTIKEYGSHIEVGYVLDEEVPARIAWELIHYSSFIK